MGTAKDDEDDGVWDEPTDDPRTRVRTSTGAAWDDPTTEDEEGRSTRIVDASAILGELKHLTQPAEAPPPGFGPVSPRGVAAPDRPEPSIGGPRSNRFPRRARKNSEETPAVGTAFMLALLTDDTTKDEVTTERPAPTADKHAAFVIVDEASLSPEERLAIEEDEAAEAEAREARYADLLEHQHLPRVVADPKTIAALSLDHRSGFVLSHIDGISSLEDILDLSGMPQTDALAILCDLVDRGIVELERVDLG